MHSKDIIAVIERAKALLIERGWQSGLFWDVPHDKASFYSVPADQRCNFCMLGALITAVGDYNDEGLHCVSKPIAEAIFKRSKMQTTMPVSITTFNDYEVTSVDDVLAVFDDAIDIVKQQEKGKWQSLIKGQY